MLVGLGRMAPDTTTIDHPPVLRAIREGLSYVARHAELRLLTIGMATFNFVYNLAYSTLVLFAEEQLHITESGYGLLLAAAGVGGLGAGYLVPKVRHQLSAGSIYGIGLLAQSAGWLLRSEEHTSELQSH